MVSHDLRPLMKVFENYFRHFSLKCRVFRNFPNSMQIGVFPTRGNLLVLSKYLDHRSLRTGVISFFYIELVCVDFNEHEEK